MNSNQEVLHSKPSERLVKHSFEFRRKSLSSPPYVVVRFFLLFFYQLVSRIHLVILLLKLSVNKF
ncbi:hypothetical protein Godav_023481 [Gossypium davidsonii]|uniref:Uncharacterized protein n=1 Tax=Gossypium davidsonii TaxID=34287 RepID=A0A7J8STE0_GOSDV|nr:hypothetical protein [Gossypium davidsonii]